MIDVLNIIYQAIITFPFLQYVILVLAVFAVVVLCRLFREVGS